MAAPVWIPNIVVQTVIIVETTARKGTAACTAPKKPDASKWIVRKMILTFWTSVKFSTRCSYGLWAWDCDGFGPCACGTKDDGHECEVNSCFWGTLESCFVNLFWWKWAKNSEIFWLFRCCCGLHGVLGIFPEQRCRVFGPTQIWIPLFSLHLAHFKKRYRTKSLQMGIEKFARHLRSLASHLIASTRKFLANFSQMPRRLRRLAINGPLWDFLPTTLVLTIWSWFYLFI